MTTPPPRVALDDQIGFALYTATRAVTARYRPALDALGITYPQLLVLMVLWEDDGLPVHAIGERLALDSGTMSPLLKRLEAAGLVSRRRNAQDEREVRIRLTDDGRALEQPACEVTAMMGGVLQLDRGQIDALKRQLEELTRRVIGQA